MSLKLNERYPARFNNPTAGYPQGSFKNRTTPTAKDGSYLEKDWANDKEGFFQSLLSSAGITANGAVDAVGASQYYDALVEIISAMAPALVQATELMAGIAKIATSTTVGTGTNDTDMVTALKLKNAYGLGDSELIDNLNSAKIGFAYSGYGATGAPAGAAGILFINTRSSSAVTNKTQSVIDTSSGIRYERSYTGGKWLAWNEVYSTSNNNMAGASVGFYLNDAPTGWLKENGASVSRTTYAKLFAIIGTSFGAGDGSTTFNLPDHRGEFPRGADDSRGVDSGRLVGSTQAQAIQSHSHPILNKATSFSFSANSGGGIPGSQVTGATELTGGTETRPRNIAKLYCIKY